jgi:hypothetical protein
MGQKTEEIMRFYEDLVFEVYEGTKFRLGLIIPMIAQFVKLVVVKGSCAQVLFPKTLGTVYFTHWLIMELLFTFAYMGIVANRPRFGFYSLARIAQLARRQLSYFS